MAQRAARGPGVRGGRSWRVSWAAVGWAGLSWTEVHLSSCVDTAGEGGFSEVSEGTPVPAPCRWHVWSCALHGG